MGGGRAGEMGPGRSQAFWSSRGGAPSFAAPCRGKSVGDSAPRGARALGAWSQDSGRLVPAERALASPQAGAAARSSPSRALPKAPAAQRAVTLTCPRAEPPRVPQRRRRDLSCGHSADQSGDAGVCSPRTWARDPPRPPRGHCPQRVGRAVPQAWAAQGSPASRRWGALPPRPDREAAGRGSSLPSKAASGPGAPPRAAGAPGTGG